MRGFTAHTVHSVTNCAYSYAAFTALVVRAFISSGDALRNAWAKKKPLSTRLGLLRIMACHLLWWHANTAVESNDFGIHVRVGNAIDDRKRELFSAAQSLREQY